MFCDICHHEMMPFQKDLRRCVKDGLISSVLPPLMELYNQEYAHKHMLYAHSELDIQLQGIRKEFVLKNTLEYDRGEILDFGCGNGIFLKGLDRHFGIKRNFDINPYEGFTRIDFLLCKYDVVTCWDVLEHMESPAGFLRGIDTKYVFITVPNRDDIKNLNEIQQWRHYRPHEHIHHYNLGSLSALLEACDFKLIEHNYNESKVRVGGGEYNLLSVCGISEKAK